MEGYGAGKLEEESMKNKKAIKIGIIIAIIVAVLVCIGIEIVHIREAKYEEAHRYLTYEELEPGQIILVQELHKQFEEHGEMLVKVNILDKEGNKYSALIPEKEWEGVEAFLEEMPEMTKTLNCLSVERTTEVYYSITYMDANAEYKYVPKPVPDMYPSPCREFYSYGMRYKVDGTVECLTIWKEESYGACYILDDPSADVIYRVVEEPL